MPATTRSRSTPQTTVDNRHVSSAKPALNKASGTKRKASETNNTTAVKKQKTQAARQTAPQNEDDDQNEGAEDAAAGESITINRAPVLELWAGCVAQFLHPSLPWTTAMSVGGAISTITAISKGRSIGTVDKPDIGKETEKRGKRKEAQADLEEIDVMSFRLKIKDGKAMVGDKSKKSNGEALKKKYGEEQYEKVKKVFQESLEQWRDKEDELDSRAFHMYEDFRPSIPKGQKGWGKKGQLDLETVRSAVPSG